jgi:uncharacterized protein (TIGR03086 family)
MPNIDLGPAAKQMASLLSNISDEMLRNPTPCPAYTLGDLVEHVGGLSLAFTAAAAKQLAGDETTQAPSGDASRLAPDWRVTIPRDLAALAAAWRAPDAWTGMTRAGGIDLPGEVAGVVALDELVIHGWDVARASGQPYEADDETLTAVEGFVAQFSGPGQEGAREGLFGPEVVVDSRAPLLDRVIGMTGRDPGWTPRRQDVSAD